MQAQFFKKDSRTRLHKNARAKANPSPQSNECMGGIPELSQSFDQGLDGISLYSHEPITDAKGRVFKKDSRIWLHKSSAPKEKSVTANETTDKASGPNRPKRFVSSANQIMTRLSHVKHDVRRPSELMDTTEMRRNNSSRRLDQAPPIPRVKSDSHLDLSTMGRQHKSAFALDSKGKKQTTRHCSTEMYGDDLREERDGEDSDRAEDDDGDNETDSFEDNVMEIAYRNHKWYGNEARDCREDRNFDVSHLRMRPEHYMSKSFLELTQDGLMHSDNLFQEMERRPFSTGRKYQRLLDDDNMSHETEGSNLSGATLINLDGHEEDWTETRSKSYKTPWVAQI